MRALHTFAAVAAVVVALGAGCKKPTPIEMFVDGFQPGNVRFEVEDKGALTRLEINELKKHPDIDGVLELPDGTCGGPCRVVIVSVFVHNMGPDAQPQAPPVVRLKSPPGKQARQPIAFHGDEISKGRIGRIRWAVEMYPEETSLTATLSSSVRLFDNGTPLGATDPLPLQPAPAPTTP